MQAVARDGDARGVHAWRVKLCLLGSTMGGKTSLIKSVTAALPHLMREEERTIGIESYTLAFNRDSHTYDAIVWDFAGQDVYQVANALFFTKQTLYLLCVDLQVYAKGLLNGSQTASAWERTAVTQRFLEQQVFRWVRLIFARQPDATLVVVGTKSDLIQNDAELKRIESDIRLRVESWCKEFVLGVSKDDPNLPVLKPNVGKFMRSPILVVSVKTESGVDHARELLENVIAQNSSIGVPMTQEYVAVSQVLQERRSTAAAEKDLLTKMDQLITTATMLAPSLTQKVGCSSVDVITILRQMHQVGEILWYERENADQFRDIVILDPKVVLDVVRELINHSYEAEDGADYRALRDGGVMSHSLLVSFPTWHAVDKAHEDLVFMFKMLMQYYQLAYPADTSKMTPVSHLIVPTYWRSKITPASPNSRGVLTKSESILRRVEQPPSFTGYWQYAVPAEVAKIIFDHFIVKSHSHLFTRTVTQDSVEATVTGRFVARIFFEVGRRKTDNIRIEVMAATDEICWKTMRFFVVAMETVLMDYPGLGEIKRDIMYRDPDSPGEQESYSVIVAMKDFEDALRLGVSITSVRKTKPWLPLTLDWFVNKVWLDPDALATLEKNAVTVEVDRYVAVIKKLSNSSDKQRLLPALFTVRVKTSDTQDVTVELQLLSDLSGVASSKLLVFPLNKSFPAKYRSWLQPGVSIFSTVDASCLMKDLVNEVVEMARTGLVDAVDRAQAVHIQIGQRDYHSLKATAETTTGLLRELFAAYDSSKDGLEILEHAALKCAKTKTGELVWANKGEIKLLGDLEGREIDALRAELETRRAVLNRAVSVAALTQLKFSLQIAQVNGVASNDWDKCFCEWQLTGSRLQENGATPPHSNSKSEPAWTTAAPLLSIKGISSLRGCTLVVKVKRKRLWVGTKVLCQGSVKLDTVILADEKKPEFKIPIIMSSSTNASSVSVDCRIILTEQEATSAGA